jgi:hypothetical protein
MTRLLARNPFAQPRTATEIVDDVCLAAHQRHFSRFLVIRRTRRYYRA